MPAPQVLESRQERWEQLPGPVLGPSPPPAQTQRREAQGSVSPFVNSRLRGLLDRSVVIMRRWLSLQELGQRS